LIFIFHLKIIVILNEGGAEVKDPFVFNGEGLPAGKAGIPRSPMAPSE
jgi:hypothetical protein